MILHVDCNRERTPDSYTGIQDAYDALISARARGGVDHANVIYVHGGDYVICRPLHFHADVPVEVQPWENDCVTISGGQPLFGWKKTRVNGKTAWRAKLPDNCNDVPFLFHGGRMQLPVRWPKTGLLRTADDLHGFVTTEENCDNFHVNRGDFNPKWYDPENIMVKMTHLWIEETLKVKFFDEKENRVWLASTMRYIPGKHDSEFFYQNVREALSESGDFYFDRKKREILIVSEMEPENVLVPHCGTLVRFDSNVKWVTLSNLHFRFGGSHLPLFGGVFDLQDAGFENIVNCSCHPSWNFAGGKKGTMPSYSGAQGAAHVPGVILFHNASDCVIRGCSVSESAWYGIQIADGCTNLTVCGNDLYNLGGGGVYVVGGDANDVLRDPSTLTNRIVIKDNHIHDCGRIFYSAIGVLITHACGCLVEGNHIHDLLYSGISCGWRWGYGETVTRENRICRNHIHDLGKGVLSDMGGIYLLGIQPGTHVYENVIHDIVNRYYGGWGLYTDEGASHIVLERNVVYNCACEGFHQHYGRENIIRFNVFAFNREHGMAFTRDALTGYAWPGEPHDKAVNVYGNVIVTDGTPAYKTGNVEMIQKHRIYADNNIFFDVSGKQPVFARDGHAGRDYSLADWQKAGLDIHSTQCDPGFRNIRKCDFRLKQKSILRQIGFDFLDKLLK